MRHYLFFISISMFSCLMTSLTWAQFHISSTTQQTKVIELYTSEGCSSCPPADQWLSTFKTHPELWHKIIPMAFHVNYWDYIGWPDRFAQEQFGERQFLHQSQGNIKNVYTPGMLLNGKAWRGWYRAGNLLKKLESEVGVLDFRLNKKTFTAHFSPIGSLKEANLEPLRLNVAILGFDLESSIKSGENKGKLLRHDFVVLTMKSFEGVNNQWHGAIPRIETNPKVNTIPSPQNRNSYSNVMEQSPSLEFNGSGDDKMRALVAWISYPNNVKPIQAVGGWLY